MSLRCIYKPVLSMDARCKPHAPNIQHKHPVCSCCRSLVCSRHLKHAPQLWLPMLSSLICSMYSSKHSSDEEEVVDEDEDEDEGRQAMELYEGI
uniref:Mads1 n=1 Tax=Arundo donax TaxID=35708 RepID=A0A0A9ELE1_ARUDO